MSYREIADARRISVASAARLVLRRRWPRQPGNDVSTRVAVPLSEIDPSARQPESSARHSTDVGPSSAPDIGPDISPDINRVVSGLEAAVAALATRAEAADQRADRAEARADRAEQALAGERSRADRAEADREAADRRADRAEARAEPADAARQRAEEHAEERRKAEADRKARGLLARLRAAWLGR